MEEVNQTSCYGPTEGSKLEINVRWPGGPILLLSLLMSCQEMSPGTQAAEQSISSHLERPVTVLRQVRLEKRAPLGGCYWG